jgi:hypothetical protein
MSNVVYKSYYTDLLNGLADHFGGSIKVLLVTDSYSPDDTNHQFVSDIIAREVTGTGYTTLGKPLTGRTQTWDTANTPHRLIFKADNLTWPSSTITARGAIVFRDTGSATNSPLWCYFDFGSNQSSVGSDFIVQWDSTLGILLLEQVA